MECTWKLHRNSIIMKAWLGRMSTQPFMLICLSLLHVNRSKTLWENTLCCVCLLQPSVSPWSSKGATGASEYACICMYVNVHVRMYVCTCAHVLHFIDLMWSLSAHCSQLPSMSPWSSKEDTVQTSSPSSVDTVIFSLTQTGYTMGQWREVNSLALPSLVHCTQFRVIQSTEWQSVEWVMCKLLTDTPFNVCTAYWATSSRAMQSSTPSSLLVSACAVYRVCPHVPYVST